MGGSVSVSSQVGKGSEFIIKLKTKAKVNQMMERPVKDVESFKSDKKYKKQILSKDLSFQLKNKKKTTNSDEKVK